MKKPFGYNDIEAKDKQKLVGELFSKVANNYDLMNDFMSLGLHKLWKKHLVYQLRPKVNQKLLDMAGGTGDIAKMYLAEGGGYAYVLDLTYAMLKKGRLSFYEEVNASNQEATEFYQDCEQDDFNNDKAERSCSLLNNKNSHIFNPLSKLSNNTIPNIDINFDQKLEWVCGDCEELPFGDRSFDKVVISFGLRNTTYVEQVIKEVHRILKVGGKFFILEFAVPKNPLASFFHKKYLFEIVPRLGKLIAKDRESYQYLSESIVRFETPEQICEIMKKIGFKNLSIEDLLLGTVGLYQGLKVR